MFVTFNREKTCLGHGKGWVESHALLHYSIPAMKCQFYCVRNTDYFCHYVVISGCPICEKPKIKTVHSKKMSTISSNFLDNALYRKMHYPWPKRLWSHRKQRCCCDWILFERACICRRLFISFLRSNKVWDGRKNKNVYKLKSKKGDELLIKMVKSPKSKNSLLKIT